jgi:hypothetical protein
MDIENDQRDFTKDNETEALDEVMELCTRRGITPLGLARIAATMHATYAIEFVRDEWDQRVVLRNAQELAGMANYFEKREEPINR